MIIATAGHVDHGKTSLIKHLTGVDTDRLEEEKRRGLSISLGYAYLPRRGDIPIGFIDVPGHQRFINTMISGVSGIDLALLIVAADDGVMPQTLEHMDILYLLGVKRAVVAVTKIDRVDEARGQEVAMSVEQELHSRHIELLSTFPVDNITGAGCATLREFLLGYSPPDRRRSTDNLFHMSIDRAFNIKGAGLVVTGTAGTGNVSSGDSLLLQPLGRRVRVRSLRVHDKDAGSVGAGLRCALNLSGDISLEDVNRGDWLCDPAREKMTERIDVEFSQIPGLAFVLKQFAPIKLYLDARRVAGRIYFLEQAMDDEKSFSGLAQLILDEPVGAFWGQRFILRDQAEEVLLGGGRVLAPFASRSKKSSRQRLDVLHALTADSSAECLEQMIATSGLIDLQKFSEAFNLELDVLSNIAPGNVIRVDAGGRRYLSGKSHWSELLAALHEYLRLWHEGNAALPGINAAELVNQLQHLGEVAIVRALLSSALKKGTIKLVDGVISLSSHSPRMPTANGQALQLVLLLIEKGGIQIPLFSELLAETQLEKVLLEKTLRDAARQGILFRVSERRHALPSSLKILAGEINAMADASDDISVISVKNRFSLGRTLTIEILEYFDAIRFTQRNGQIRRVIDPSLPDRLFNPSATDE